MDGATDDLFLAGEAVYEFGRDLGMYQVSMFIADLADACTQEQIHSGFCDGVGDTSTTAAEGMSCDNSWVERDDFNRNLTFTDLDLLHQAANAIREEGRTSGAAAAVQAIRDWYDGLSDDLGKHYYEGILYALDRVGASFGVDPDPSWKPYDPPEDPEEDE